ncbi:NAD-aldehyde dehydrogenase [Athelia psychrophila]|uniref:Aldehyde dehydrogenase n=1 Tax=Athelia psychrophila TaxID=1759441 RepID=A0A166FKB5_9AGAM|nr:NAD-aldehyde dehydrogenase [Fibularhizoctonia sp. CBS 109695]
MSFATTPISDISRIRDECRAGFASGKTRDVQFRKAQLLALAYLLKENIPKFEAAIYADTRRPAFEVNVIETAGPIAQAMLAYNSVEKWAKTEKAPWNRKFWAMKPKVRKEPKGTVLVIGPYNSPVWSSFIPLIGAIAAGNAAVLKMSELAPAVCALVNELWPKYMDTSVYQLVNGAIPETTELLRLQWDHILYTGSGRVGRIVAAAAAKHLTPITLELGGKNPVYIDPTCNLPLAARRLLWGKTGNAGQVCIAPDYVLVPREFQDKLVEALTTEYNKFYPDGPAKSDSFSRLGSAQQFTRVKAMLDGTKGRIVLGGETDEAERFIAPTIVRDCTVDDSLMQDEIFGPLLPIVPVAGLEEAIAIINSKDHALVAYIFSKDSATKETYFARTQSGAAVANETLLHGGVAGLPYGGTGASGIGSVTGKFGFDTFTHERASIDSPPIVDMVMKRRYPPYTKEHMRFLVGKTVPKLPSRDPNARSYDPWYVVAIVIAFGSAFVQWRSAVAREGL